MTTTFFLLYLILTDARLTISGNTLIPVQSREEATKICQDFKRPAPSSMKVYCELWQVNVNSHVVVVVKQW